VRQFKLGKFCKQNGKIKKLKEKTLPFKSGLSCSPFLNYKKKRGGGLDPHWLRQLMGLHIQYPHCL
jgi:hypothetical protein